MERNGYLTSVLEKFANHSYGIQKLFTHDYFKKSGFQLAVVQV